MKGIKLILLSLLAFFIIGWMVMNSKVMRSKSQSLSFSRNMIDAGNIERPPIINSSEIEQAQLIDKNIYVKRRNDDVIYVVKADQLFAIGACEQQEGGLIIHWGLDGKILFNVNARNRMITEVDNGRDRFHYTLLRPFSRIMRLARGLYLVKGIDDHSRIDDYYTTDFISKKEIHFGNLLTDHQDDGFANDGFFISNNNGQFFHISYYQSDILAFDSKGYPFYKTNTIDHTSTVPPTTRSRNGIRFISPRAIVINKSAAANKDFLFILSNAHPSNESGGKRNGVIDVYATNSGKYLKSFRLPVAAGETRSISVNEQQMLYLTRHQLYVISLEHIL